MTAPRILILGAGGQLGRHMQDALADLAVTAVAHGDCDIGDAASLARNVAAADPTIVINCAAYTRVDDAETDEATARRVNAEGPGLVAALCAARGARLIHISTDYVFGGVPPRDAKLGYTPTDEPAPLNRYGATKLAGEDAVRSALGEYWIIRASWLFSCYGSNFVRTMLRLAEERTALRVVNDQVGTPTWAGHLAGACRALVDAIGRGAPPPTGTYHFAGTPAVSWHAFAEVIVGAAFAGGLLRRRPAIFPITSAEFPRPATRPRDSRLYSGDLQARLGLPAAAWGDGLAALLKAPLAA